MIVYRIYDPVEGKFCCSGRGLYAKNGRSIWLALSGAKLALKHMPAPIKDRLVIREFELAEVREEMTYEEYLSQRTSRVLYVMRDHMWNVIIRARSENDEERLISKGEFEIVGMCIADLEVHLGLEYYPCIIDVFKETISRRMGPLNTREGAEKHLAEGYVTWHRMGKTAAQHKSHEYFIDKPPEYDWSEVTDPSWEMWE